MPETRQNFYRGATGAAPARGAWQQRRSFGPLLRGGRFDHHLPPTGHDPERSVWYAATRLVGAVAEAYGPLGFLDRSGGRRRAQGALIGIWSGQR